MNSSPWLPGRAIPDRGFTLVEILVVLLIVGLIGTIASLRVGSSSVVAFEDESNRLRQAIESGFDRSRLARIRAVWRADADWYELTIGEAGADHLIVRRVLDMPVRIVSVWHEGALQKPPYELSLSGREPGLFRIEVGSEQGARFELRSTLLGRVEVVPSN